MALIRAGAVRQSGESSTKLRGLAVLGLTSLILWGCATPPPPRNIDNLCDIFMENEKWYEAAHRSYRKWGIPVYILMAFLHQESKFEGRARPPRASCLGVVPLPRRSSAYGYAQAKDETWQHYQRSTGRRFADRDNFADAVDFVGWYCNLSHTRCGISKLDPYHLYLAYHEGQGGFERKTYAKKDWLLKVARKVERRANTYEQQMASCEERFRLASCLWPF